MSELIEIVKKKINEINFKDDYFKANVNATTTPIYDLTDFAFESVQNIFTQKLNDEILAGELLIKLNEFKGTNSKIKNFSKAFLDSLDKLQPSDDELKKFAYNLYFLIEHFAANNFKLSV
jgi:hypothetical protein